MRKCFLLALLLAPALAGAQTVTGAQNVTRIRDFVDLDRPGALDAIAKSNPATYLKISNILDTAAVQSCEHLPKILSVTHGVSDTKCHSMLLMASYPPNRQLVFSLDDTTYMSNVALTGFKPQIFPAVETRPVKPLR